MRNSIFNKEIGTLEIVSAYEIIDSAGDELSSAVGPGISLIYYLGFMLTGIAGTSLVMRKRRRVA